MLVLLEFYTDKAGGQGLRRVEELYLGVLDGLDLLTIPLTSF